MNLEDEIIGLRQPLDAICEALRAQGKDSFASSLEDIYLIASRVPELEKDKQRLNAAESLQLNMEVTENCAGNIERYVVALNRRNLDKLITETKTDSAIVVFDRPKLEMFKLAHAAAKGAEFTFDGHQFDVKYALYLIEFLEEKLK